MGVAFTAACCRSAFSWAIFCANTQMPYKPWPCTTVSPSLKDCIRMNIHFYGPWGKSCSPLHPRVLTTVAECALCGDSLNFKPTFLQAAGAAFVIWGCRNLNCRQHLGLSMAFGCWGQWAQRATPAVGAQTRHWVPPWYPAPCKHTHNCSQHWVTLEPARGH